MFHELNPLLIKINDLIGTDAALTILKLIEKRVEERRQLIVRFIMP